MSQFITLTVTIERDEKVSTIPGLRLQVRHIIAYGARWSAKPEKGSSVKMLGGMDYNVAETAEEIDKLIEATP
jgi:hypothetical protein